MAAFLPRIGNPGIDIPSNEGDSREIQQRGGKPERGQVPAQRTKSVKAMQRPAIRKANVHRPIEGFQAEIRSMFLASGFVPEIDVLQPSQPVDHLQREERAQAQAAVTVVEGRNEVSSL